MSEIEAEIIARVSVSTHEELHVRRLTIDDEPRKHVEIVRFSPRIGYHLSVTVPDEPEILDGLIAALQSIRDSR